MYRDSDDSRFSMGGTILTMIGLMAVLFICAQAVGLYLTRGDDPLPRVQTQTAPPANKAGDVAKPVTTAPATNPAAVAPPATTTTPLPATP